MEIRDFIIKNHKKMTYEEMAKELGVELWVIKNITQKMIESNELDSKKVIWTKEEENYLIEWYGKIPNKRLAENLGMTWDQVRKKIYYLRKKDLIAKHPRYKNLTNENKLVEEGFKRLINQPRDLGLANKEFSYKFTIGKKYRLIGADKDKRVEPLNFTGVLVQETEDFFVIKHKLGYCESFLKKDYLLGDYKIKEA